MVGPRFEWRDGKIWEIGGGIAGASLCDGEYIRNFSLDGREEFENIWTGERFILEEDENWMGGPYFQRGTCALSLRDPELKIELSANAVKHWNSLWMLGERPVYFDDVARDARTDDAVLNADCFWVCDAGFAVRVGKKLCFADGVREDLPLGEIKGDEDVEFLRVSETEYSIKVGKDRYYLLDTANWTCIKI